MPADRTEEIPPNPPNLSEQTIDIPSISPNLMPSQDSVTVGLEQPSFLIETPPNGTRLPDQMVLPHSTSLPQIPGYEIVEELGRGGMGVVYKARQTAVNRIVALKMILSGDHSSNKDRARFQIEAEAVARLSHPNIVQIYEVGEHNSLPYFSLEFCEGGTLADRLDGTPFPPTEAARIVEHLAQAMGTAHRAGIIHRDLKPANILLSSPIQRHEAISPQTPLTYPSGSSLSELLHSDQWIPKISDFGLAKRLDSDNGQTQSGALVGTPSYMSPEQALGQSHRVGVQSDVYALGAILYELLTGRPPFKGATVLETLEQVRMYDPISPRLLQTKIPKDLETICLKCLQKSPARRYTSAEDLADDLRRYLNHEPISARPTNLLERVWRWSQRNPGVAVLTTLLAFALLSGFAGILLEHRKVNRQKDLVELQKIEVEKQRERAESNLQHAIEAVDKMLVHVADGPLEFVPQFQDERRQLLEEAIRFYQKLLEQESEDPRLRYETAKVCNRVATTALRLAEFPRAEIAVQKGLDLIQQLITEFPNQADHHWLHSDLLMTYAGLMQHQENLDLARYFLNQALSIVSHLIDQYSKEQEYLRQRIRILTRMGYVEFSRLNRKETREYFEQAVRLSDQLSAISPDLIENRSLTAESYQALGFFLVNTFVSQEAIPSLTKATQMVEALLNDCPKDRRKYEPMLARCQVNLGFALTMNQRESEGRSLLDRGIAVFERLVQEYPGYHDYRFNLMMGYNARAQIEQTKRQSSDAERIARQAMSISVQLVEEQPKTVHYRLYQRMCQADLAMICVDLQKYAEAEKLLKEVITECEKHIKANPTPNLVNQLFHYVQKYNDALNHLDRAKESVAALERYREILQENKKILPPRLADHLDRQSRLLHALARIRIGDSKQGLADAEAILGCDPVQDSRYNLACAYAVAALAARQNTTLSESERLKLETHYADKAMNLLNSSIDHMRAVRGRIDLNRDPDLDALRKRADFQELLKQF